MNFETRTIGKIPLDKIVNHSKYSHKIMNELFVQGVSMQSYNNNLKKKYKPMTSDWLNCE